MKPTAAQDTPNGAASEDDTGNAGHIKKNELLDEVARESGVKRADAKAAIDAFLAITLPDGTFRPQHMFLSCRLLPQMGARWAG